jgi:hypothetical protein
VGYNRSIKAIVLSPPYNASFGDVKQLNDVFRYIFMQDEPEHMLLRVFADVVVNHGKVEFPRFTQKKKIAGLFFFFLNGNAMVSRIGCNV